MERKRIGFRVVANLSYRPETRADDSGHLNMISGEGCFSTWNTSTRKRRWKTLRQVTANDAHTGEPLVAREVTGLGARSVQHETDHLERKLTGDGKGRFRAIVSRDPNSPYYVDNYIIERLAGRGLRWPWTQSDADWEAMTRDPDYPFQPTTEAQVAFQAGRDAIIERRRRRS